MTLGSAQGCAPHPSRAGGRLRRVGAALLLLAMAAPLLASCGPDAQSAASANQAKLDKELRTASATAGVPAGRLAPIIAQEQTLAAATKSGSSASYQTAADGYTKLYNQVVALEKTTPSQAQAMATGDLSALQSALAAAQRAGIPAVTTAANQFAPAVPQAQQQLATATTTREYFAVDSLVLDQNAAVTQLLPVYQQIQQLSQLVATVTKALAPKPGAAHPLECATEGGEIASYGLVPAQFWAAQNAYPISVSHPIMVTPQAPAQNFYFSAWPSQALAAFEGARKADDLAALSVEMVAQTQTLTANLDPDALPRYQVAADVARFQNDVNTYETDAKANNAFLAAERAKTHDVPDYRAIWSLSQNSQGYAPPLDFFPDVPNFSIDGKYAQQAAQDATTLAAAKSSADFAALTRTVAQQEQALAYPLLRVRAYYDTNITLVGLIAIGQSTTTNVTYNGVLYKTPNAYEYADDDLRYEKKDTVGIQDAQERIDQAVYREGYVSSADATADWQGIENEAQMFIHNLSAMITNLRQMPTSNTARKAWSMTSHQTDIDLLNYYGLMGAKVIVVSLREQKARLYQDGKMVVGSNGKPYAFDVTTGSPDKPSVPGIHCALPPLKGPPGGDLFKSADPPGSPFYYQPTPIHFSYGYSLYGYYMHDGWWRDGTEMGYLTNLPHYDPAAFNGGSHGCINFHYANGDMAKVYAFSSAGIPIIVY